MKKWNIEYDDGQIHSIIIHKVNYVPEDPICPSLILQWYQQATDNHPKPDGTWCNTNSKHCIIYWNQERYEFTIPWETGNNAGCIFFAPRTNKYHIIMEEIEEYLNSEDK